MNELIFEWNKIKNRKWSIWLLIISALFLIIVLRTLTMLEYAEGNYSEGQFKESVAFAIISFSSLYLFVPLWILLFTGIELVNGHVQQVVFYRSYKFYLKLKLYYCLLITLYFTLISITTFFFIYLTAPFNPVISVGFILSFVVQAFVTFLVTALLVLCIVMLTRSAPLAFGIYFGWSIVETIIFKVISRIYQTDLFFMPLHVVNLLYLKNGEKDQRFYYNPFIDFNYSVLALPVFIGLILIITYRDFIKRELKPLSD